MSIFGLVDHQVLQRDTAVSGRIAVAGSSEGAVRLRVVDPSGKPATDWEEAGTGGPWKAELVVPVGGPYDLMAEEEGAQPVALARSILVGDLWVLAGQSNMQGVGILGPEVELPYARTAVLDITRRWRPAIDPLHRLYASPDPVHNMNEDAELRAQLAEADARSPLGAGLGVPFANAMVAKTGVPVGLIATAHGGTSLAQWSPELKHEGGRSLFGSMLLGVDAAGGSVAGVLWYQGESDALELAAETFSERLRALVEAVRDELRHPDLPFFHVQLGRVTHLPGLNREGEGHWASIREAQRLVDLGPGGLVTAVDLPLSDPIHISTRGLQRLGRRLAAVASGSAATVTVENTETTVPRRAAPDAPEAFEIRVRLAGITPPLTPAEHMAGFTLRSAAGEERPWIYSSVVDPTDPQAVIISGLGNLEEGDTISYGYGFDPYCNLVDADDMAVPAFGPLVLAPIRLDA